MKPLIALLLCAALASPPMYGVDKKKAKFMGGTSDLKQGAVGRIHYGADAVVFDFRKKGTLTIPFAAVTHLEYGQRASRRVGQTIGLALLVGPFALPLLLTKRRRHYLSVAWTEDGADRAAVLELGKAATRPVTQAMAMASGVELQFQDEKARGHYGR